METAGESLVFLLVAAVFGYHLWTGWRTRIVRFPMSVFVAQEFEHDQSPGNFWGIMILDLLGAVAALAAALVAWGGPRAPARPVARLESLDGCYEGEGLPDFMRPPVHWGFRVAGGIVFDRDGKAVSTIRLLGGAGRATALAFSPGILISDNEHKETTVYPGDAVAGKAWLEANRARIEIADRWGQVDVMQTTSCG